MLENINFNRQVNAIQRNGLVMQDGLSVMTTDDDVVQLSALNTNRGVVSGFLEIPIEHLEEVTALFTKIVKERNAANADTFYVDIPPVNSDREYTNVGEYVTYQAALEKARMYGADENGMISLISMG